MICLLRGVIEYLTYETEQLACLRHISVDVSCCRETGLGGSVGDHISCFVKVEIVVCGVLSIVAWFDVLMIVAMRRFSVDYDLVGV